jgi:hypothetical protein
MDLFASKGPAGVGAAYASFAVLNSLIRHLEASGVLIPADVTKILEGALDQVPGNNVAAREDARRLIEGLRP